MYGVFLVRSTQPQNILLRSDDDHIFITDFGVSGIKGVDSTTDLLTTQCGTPTYIAPEIISHAGAGYSGEKVDCWALGVILFFMLTGGKLPFDDDRLEMLFDKIQTAAVEYPERISADAVDLIEKLLTKSPARRLSAKQIRSHHWYRARSGRRKRRPGERRGSGNLGSTGSALSSASASLASSATPSRPAPPPPPAPSLRLSFAEKKETEEAIGQLQLLIARSSRYIPAVGPPDHPPAAATAAGPSADNSSATRGSAAVGADYLDSLFSADGPLDDPSAAEAAAPSVDTSLATGGPAAVGADYLDALFDDDDGPPPPTPLQRQIQGVVADAPPATGSAAATQQGPGRPSSQFQSLLRLCDPSPTPSKSSAELRDGQPGEGAVTASPPAGGAAPRTSSDRPRAAAAGAQPPLRRVATQRALARVRASMFSLTAEDPSEEPDHAVPTVAPSRPMVRGAPSAPSELVIAARQALDAWEKAMGGDGADAHTPVPVSDEQLGALKQLLDLWKHPASPLEHSPLASTGGRQQHPSDSSASPSASSPSSVCTTNTTPAAESLPGYSPPVDHASSAADTAPRFDHKELNEEWGRVLNANPPAGQPSRGVSDLGRRPPDRGPSTLGSGSGTSPSQRARSTLYSSSGVRVTQVDDAALDAVGESSPTASARGSLAHVEGVSQPTLPRTSSSVAAMAAAERVTAAERIAKQVRQQERALAALSLSDDEITEVSPDKVGDELLDGVSAVSLSLPGASSRPPAPRQTPHARTGGSPLSDQGSCAPVIVTTSSVFFRGDALPAEAAGAGTTAVDAVALPARPGRGGGAAGAPVAINRGAPPATRFAVTKSVVRDPARFEHDDETALPVPSTASPVGAPSVAGGGLVAGRVSTDAADIVGTVAVRGRLMQRSDAGADRVPLTSVPGASASCESVVTQRPRPSAAAPATHGPGGGTGAHAEPEGGSILSSLLSSRVVRHGQSESHDSSFSWGRLVGGSRDGSARSQLSAGAVAAPTALAVKGLKRLGFAPRTAAEPGAAAAAATVGVSVGNSSGLVFESAMSRDRCMTTVGRLLVDDLFCDVLSRTDGGHSKLRCSLPNQKNEWPIKIYFEPIDREGADVGGGGGGGGGGSSSGSSARRSKAPSPRLARTVVVMSKGRASDLTPAQLRGFYDQVVAKFRASAPDAVVGPSPSSKPWR